MATPTARSRCAAAGSPSCPPSSPSNRCSSTPPWAPRTPSCSSTTSPPDPAGAAALWQDEPTDSALPSLLGRTRADVMECLRETGSTGEIARRLKISNPSVSQHIGVLRRAGLVATERRHNASVHTLTPLGEAVLG
ncbi:winged helix-turn-helix domain-containing protein [Streptomyces halobius]|uniref:Winged helix-turn-helix domain-containing protein n=2 Tax=Streptomyces halobius TaxID=2879846 RepID=A0ABY4M893_9ACTN|nr:winged helix-turn-helix domain-containing protein [Streptomyces halobius]